MNAHTPPRLRRSKQRPASRPESFHNVLLDMIDRSNLSIREVAIRFGVSEEDVKSWVDGSVIPPRVVRVGARQLLAARIATMAPDWSPSEDALLGTDTDEAIARRLGRSQNSVMIRRRALGIPAAIASRGRRGEWTDAALALLGKVPDRVVAARVGVSVTAVFSKRRTLGIPAFMPNRSRNV